jgi:hypothetical protein
MQARYYKPVEFSTGFCYFLRVIAQPFPGQWDGQAGLPRVVAERFTACVNEGPVDF